MNMKRTLMFFLTLFPIIAVKSQFYTIKKDTNKVEFLSNDFSIRNKTLESKFQKVVTEQKGYETLKDDSILIDLLKKRISICMPLDYIYLNSGYGYRKDPITRCKKFHDGIDLRCNYSNVYSILPGIVKNVAYSNYGYGNSITIDYGNFCCLYGHLSTIYIKKGQHVDAGMTIGISGSSGKSTGPHLHMQLSRNNKHINPYKFIVFLSTYIRKINKEIGYYK